MKKEEGMRILFVPFFLLKPAEMYKVNKFFLCFCIM